MNKRIYCAVFCAFINAVLLLDLTGCQTASVTEDRAQGTSSATVALLPEAMMSALLQTDDMRTLSAQRQSLMVSFVKNETSQYIDTRLLTEEILRGLLNADIIYQLATHVQTDEKLPPLRLRLESVVTSGIQENAASNDLRAVNLITLRLIDSETGATRWSDTRPLPVKQ